MYKHYACCVYNGRYLYIYRYIKCIILKFLMSLIINRCTLQTAYNAHMF